MELLKKIGAAIAAYPTSWDDYIGVGRWMIYKKLMVILCACLTLAIMVMAVVIWRLLHPTSMLPEDSIPVFYYMDDSLMRYSGEVILVDGEEHILYRGQVQEGLRSGWGRAYPASGSAPLYEGEFLQGFYSGYGSLYSLTGNLVYEGNFLEGKYDGAGTLYQDGADGALLYEGTFSGGAYSGYGVLYRDDLKCYEGDFAHGRYEGEGVEYDLEGNIVYTGGFVRGKREGWGMETDVNGNPVYEGEFRSGVYHGDGTLYTEAGARLRFEGSFFNGQPGRKGKIYNMRGSLLYDGPIYHGDVDGMQLLGLDIGAWSKYISEIPVIYYGDGFAGFLYCELGLAGIGSYDLMSQEEEVGFQPDDILLNTLLLEGERYGGHLPTRDSVASWSYLTGQEAFMGAALTAAARGLRPEPLTGEILREGDYLYYVTALPALVDFQGEAVWWEYVYYINEAGAWDKGGIADVVYCRKAIS